MPNLNYWEAVIGLETHVQLSTKSKMFCSCSADHHGVEPNTLVCPVCLALPGSLPVVNRHAIAQGILIGIALNCKVASVTKFDRKNYTYPDLMKGYQISQYDRPICSNGELQLPTNPPHRIRIERVHLEEDVSRLVHIDAASGKDGYSLLDVNRSGVPLAEIVTMPDFRTADQVSLYIEMLQSIIRYLEVGNANMEEGSFRCDANVSVRSRGSDILNPKVEIKNMNRITAVSRAVSYEIKRQTAIYEKGGRVFQETRGWDEEAGVTKVQRSKEDTNDYRYFPEPDLYSIEIDEEWQAEIRSGIPELPAQRKERFIREWGISDYDASQIIAERSTAEYFDDAVSFLGKTPDADKFYAVKNVVNWLNTEVTRLLHEDETLSISDGKVNPRDFVALVEKFRLGEITNNVAKQVMEEMFRKGGDPSSIIEKRSLGKVNDDALIRSAAKIAIDNNPNAVKDYLRGKVTAARFLVGKVMKSTEGRADPAVALSIIKEELASVDKQQDTP